MPWYHSGSIENAEALARLKKFVNDKDEDERQQRLDMFACAALTGFLASGKGFTGYSKEASKEAYNYAEAMEAERKRRMKVE
jgi:hypothetical protein